MFATLCTDWGDIILVEARPLAEPELEDCLLDEAKNEKFDGEKEKEDADVVELGERKEAKRRKATMFMLKEE